MPGEEVHLIQHQGLSLLDILQYSSAQLAALLFCTAGAAILPLASISIGQIAAMIGMDL